MYRVIFESQGIRVGCLELSAIAVSYRICEVPARFQSGSDLGPRNREAVRCVCPDADTVNGREMFRISARTRVLTPRLAFSGAILILSIGGPGTGPAPAIDWQGRVETGADGPHVINPETPLHPTAPIFEFFVPVFCFQPKETKCPKSIASTVRLQRFKKILSAYHRSGLSQERFCSENRIPYSSFYRWLVKSRKAANSNLPAIIPIGAVPDSSSPIEIELANEHLMIGVTKVQLLQPGGALMLAGALAADQGWVKWKKVW